MKKTAFVSALVAMVVVVVSCLNKVAETPLRQSLALFKTDVAVLAASADTLVQAAERNDGAALRDAFKKSRLAFKKTEWLAAYYNPLTTRQLNGPALPEVEPSDKNIVIAPEGYQVVEELIFPEYDTADKAEVVKQVKMLRSTVGRLQTIAATLETTDAHILDALRLQVFRIITLGISGFDSPIAKASIPEAAAALASIQTHLSFYTKKVADNDGTQKEIDGYVSGAVRFLASSISFDSLDRMALITNHLNPLTAAITSLQKKLGIPFFTEPRALRATAATLFADSAFNPEFYTPDAAAAGTAAKRVVGEKLFYDAVLSGEGRRSCASCHHPQQAFTDGLKVADALSSRVRLKRNTPTLVNAGLQPQLFYDMRVSFLEDQAAEVIKNKDEMHGDFSKAVVHLQNDTAYQRLFAAAFGSNTVTEAGIKNGLAVYIRSLTLFTTPFDKYMRGDKAALTPQQVRGFNLFMGKAACGTCHFAPLFSGVNPPDFTKVDAEIIGVPNTPNTLHATLDADEGKYNTYKIPLQRFAFKTPTLRNISVTAPYMHNGVYSTLEQVMDFYNRGGGRGLGYPVEGQTLPDRKLNLSATEQQAVVAFLRSLTDERFRPVKTALR